MKPLLEPVLPPQRTTELDIVGLSLLKSKLRPQFFKKGEVITAHGEIGAHPFVVSSGLALIEVRYPEGKWAPAQFVPPRRGFYPSYTPTAPSVFQVTALADTHVVFVPNDVIYLACTLSPQFATGFVASLLHRTNDGYLAYARLSHMPLERQLAFLYWWLTLSEPPDEATGAKLLAWKIPQGTLADFFGISREEVNRKLKNLEQQGHMVRAPEGVWLYPCITELFKGYGDPSPPVSFIASLLDLTEE